MIIEVNVIQYLISFLYIICVLLILSHVSKEKATWSVYNGIDSVFSSYSSYLSAKGWDSLFSFFPQVAKQLSPGLGRLKRI